jgi:hypothetical protein
VERFLNRIAASGTMISSRKDRRWSNDACGETQPGPYQLQAAINAVHSDAATESETDWNLILALFDGSSRSPRPRSGRSTEPSPSRRSTALRKALELIDGLSLDGYNSTPRV